MNFANNNRDAISVFSLSKTVDIFSPNFVVFFEKLSISCLMIDMIVQCSHNSDFYFHYKNRKRLELDRHSVSFSGI